jgi:hypothetical protein
MPRITREDDVVEGGRASAAEVCWHARSVPRMALEKEDRRAPPSQTRCVIRAGQPDGARQQPPSTSTVD